MMFDSVLVKVSCSEELLYLHTISRRHKSPYRFAILRDTLEQLEREPGRQIIVAACGCYAALRLTRALDGEMLVIRFSWLQAPGRTACAAMRSGCGGPTAASTSVWRPGRIWPDGTGASSPCRRR